MTKSRSKGWAVPGLLLLALSGCVTRSGVPVDGALTPALAYAYIPLKRPSPVLPEADAGAVALGGGVAVTAAHAADMVPAKDLIALSREHDLAFFRTDRSQAVLSEGVPRLGAKVVAYAHYDDTDYKAEGVISALDAVVLPQCDGCAEQRAFRFEGNAGPGYSGGPVLDSETGQLIGILFGYLDGPGEDGRSRRSLYVYPMALVRDELEKAAGTRAEAGGK